MKYTNYVVLTILVIIGIICITLSVQKNEEYYRYAYDINSIMELMSDKKKEKELINMLNSMTIEDLRNLSNELKGTNTEKVQNFLSNLTRYIQNRENEQPDENIQVDENSPPELINNYLEYLIENEYDMRQLRDLNIPEINEKINNLKNIIKNNQGMFNVLNTTQQNRLQDKIGAYLFDYNDMINIIKEKELNKKIYEDIEIQEKQKTSKKYDNPFTQKLIAEQEERMNKRIEQTLREKEREIQENERKYYENLNKEPEIQPDMYHERPVNEPLNKKSYLMYIIGAIIIISVILYFILKKKK